MKATRLSVSDRFWAKVDKSGGPDACWPWTASVFAARGGYGKFQAGSSRTTARAVYAHRFAWELANGQIPQGLFICHACDNPPCCNPAHLFLGSPADNMLDMAFKGRHHLHGRLVCKHGHPWNAANTYFRTHRNGKTQRVCRACKRESYRRNKEKR